MFGVRSWHKTFRNIFSSTNENNENNYKRKQGYKLPLAKTFCVLHAHLFFYHQTRCWQKIIVQSKKNDDFRIFLLKKALKMYPITFPSFPVLHAERAALETSDRSLC